MAQARQLAFLNKLHNELSVSSSTYRKMVVDTQWHTFKVSQASIKAATNKEFKKYNITPSTEQLLQIDLAVQKAYTSILNKVKLVKKDPQVIIDRNTTYLNSKRLRLVFITYGEPIDKAYRAQLDPGVTFDRLKIIYKESLQIFFDELQKITDNAIAKYNKKSGRLNKVKTVGKFFHLGHLDTMGVAETQFRDGLANAFESLPLEEHSNITSLLEKAGVDLSFQRLDDKDMMIVQIESASDNMSRGGITGNQKKQLLSSLKTAMSKFDPMTIAGSDSPKERKLKQLTKNLVKPFENIKSKNLKTNTKTKPLKKSSSKKQTVSTDGKARKGSSLIKIGQIAVKSKRRAKKDNSPASSPLHMIVAINKKLPQVVAQNMQSPHLNYQTGRFAESVRVTEAVTTPKGFPSIGYTYDKFPYQTFEVGYAQGDLGLDPRKLIDKSIREIAAELAIGRFFTRRV